MVNGKDGKGEEYRHEDIKQEMVFNIPNMLTMLRIILAPIFLILILNNNYLYALITLIIASITDFFDGGIARWYNMQTKIGAILDPIADITFMTFAMIALLMRFEFPIWLGVLIFLRDFTILSGGILVYFFKVSFTKENTLGKIARFMQLLTIIIYVITYLANYNTIITPILLYVTGALTLASIIVYLHRGYRLFISRKRKS